MQTIETSQTSNTQIFKSGKTFIYFNLLTVECRFLSRVEGRGQYVEGRGKNVEGRGKISRVRKCRLHSGFEYLDPAFSEKPSLGSQFYSRAWNWSAWDANNQCSLYLYILLVHLNCIFVCIKLFCFDFVSFVIILIFSVFLTCTPTPRFRNTPYLDIFGMLLTAWKYSIVYKNVNSSMMQKRPKNSGFLTRDSKPACRRHFTLDPRHFSLDPRLSKKTYTPLIGGFGFD